MSGISPTAPTPPTAPTNVSSVGASLFANGGAPNVAHQSAPAPAPNTESAYQTAFKNLQQYDANELLYASFLSPEDALANGNAVLQQAAQLLGTPSQPGASVTPQAPAAPPASTTPAPAAQSPRQSVTAILAASDAAAQTTLKAYGSAPAGSSILDFQA